MKYTADIYHMTAQPIVGANCSITPIEADNEAAAAREAAEFAAEVYAKGSVGFVSSRGHGLFLATIGVYQGGGLTRGHSVSIKVTEK
jgi:hypothetical protein